MNQNRFLSLTAVAMFLVQSVTLMLSPLLVDLAAEFGVSVAADGQLAAVTFAAWAVSVISVGQSRTPSAGVRWQLPD